MPTTADLIAAPMIQCRYVMADGKRCLMLPPMHGSCPVCHADPHVSHPYESLATPCLHCDAAISWSAGDWRDSTGNVGHVPDPSFL